MQGHPWTWVWRVHSLFHAWGHQLVESTGPTGARVPIIIHLEMPPSTVPRPQEGQVQFSFVTVQQSVCGCSQGWGSSSYF